VRPRAFAVLRLMTRSYLVGRYCRRRDHRWHFRGRKINADNFQIVSMTATRKMQKGPKSVSNSSQGDKKPNNFELGPLGTLNQVIKALGKTLRAMADDTIDSQKGARICNGLGILRQCVETAMLDELERRLDDIEATTPTTGTLREQVNERRLHMQ
jgi:hypothetical protein